MTEVHEVRVHTESVVLDIGGDIGALVLYTDGSLCSAEIEISLQDGSAPRVHSQVHERLINGQIVFAAVYPNLAAGDYDIWRDHSTRAGKVRIDGGCVATVDWRT